MPAAPVCTEAMYSFGASWIDSMIGRWSSSSSSSTVGWKRVKSSLKSAPAEKPPPAPWITATRAPGSALAARAADRRSRRIAASKAFSESGRLSAVVAIRPETR